MSTQYKLLFYLEVQVSFNRQWHLPRVLCRIR